MTDDPLANFERLGHEAQLAVIAQNLRLLAHQRTEQTLWERRVEDRLRKLENWNYRVLGALCVLSVLASAALAVLR